MLNMNNSDIQIEFEVGACNGRHQDAEHDNKRQTNVCPAPHGNRT